MKGFLLILALIGFAFAEIQFDDGTFEKLFNYEADGYRCSVSADCATCISIKQCGWCINSTYTGGSCFYNDGTLTGTCDGLHTTSCPGGGEEEGLLKYLPEILTTVSIILVVICILVMVVFVVVIAVIVTISAVVVRSGKKSLLPVSRSAMSLSAPHVELTDL